MNCHCLAEKGVPGARGSPSRAELLGLKQVSSLQWRPEDSLLVAKELALGTCLIEGTRHSSPLRGGDTHPEEGEHLTLRRRSTLSLRRKSTLALRRRSTLTLGISSYVCPFPQ